MPTDPWAPGRAQFCGDLQVDLAQPGPPPTFYESYGERCGRLSRKHGLSFSTISMMLSSRHQSHQPMKVRRSGDNITITAVNESRTSIETRARRRSWSFLNAQYGSGFTTLGMVCPRRKMPDRRADSGSKSRHRETGSPDTKGSAFMIVKVQYVVSGVHPD